MGYPALIENNNYEDNAVVLEDAEVLQIPREDFLEMIYGDISVAARFIHIITQNVKEKEERLLNLAYSSLRKRVARALMDIHKKYNADVAAAVMAISPSTTVLIRWSLIEGEGLRSPCGGVF